MENKIISRAAVMRRHIEACSAGGTTIVAYCKACDLAPPTITNGILQIIDNNLIENTIRPVALGRKNYLFAGSHERAQDAAMLYSLFATCRLHNVNPEHWLTNLFNQINSTEKEHLYQLLPQNYTANFTQQWRGWPKGYNNIKNKYYFYVL